MLKILERFISNKSRSGFSVAAFILLFDACCGLPSSFGCASDIPALVVSTYVVCLLFDTPTGGGLEFINISGIVVTRASDWH